MSAADATDNGNPFPEQLSRRLAATIGDENAGLFSHETRSTRGCHEVLYRSVIRFLRVVSVLSVTS